MEILLVIDIQEKYMGFYKEDLVDIVNTKIVEAQNKGVPVIYVRNVGILGDSEKYTFCENLKMVSDKVFVKKVPSAFSNESFSNSLKDMGVDVINVVGVDGRCCVYKTVMEAVKNGYHVRLHLDAIGARSDKFYSKELEIMKANNVEFI